jgi:hypothetical protein
MGQRYLGRVTEADLKAAVLSNGLLSLLHQRHNKNSILNTVLRYVETMHLCQLSIDVHCLPLSLK